MYQGGLFIKDSLYCELIRAGQTGRAQGLIWNHSKDRGSSVTLGGNLCLTCTCGGIHPRRVESTSPIDLTTSRIGALQAHWRLSPSPFSIVSSRRLAVRRGVPGLPWPWLPTSSVSPQFACLREIFFQLAQGGYRQVHRLCRLTLSLVIVVPSTRA